MRIETGIIAEIKGNQALVESDPDEGCASCSAKGACMMSSTEKKRKIWIKNTINANPGDMITFSIEEKGVVLSSFVLYVLPIILFISGIMGAGFLYGFRNEGYIIAGGLIGLLAAFIIMRYISKILNKKKIFTPKMLEIVSVKKNL